MTDTIQNWRTWKMQDIEHNKECFQTFKVWGIVLTPSMFSPLILRLGYLSNIRFILIFQAINILCIPVLDGDLTTEASAVH